MAHLSFPRPSLTLSPPGSNAVARGEEGGAECETAADCVSSATLLTGSDRARAKALFTRATELNPRSKLAWLGLGAIAQEDGDLDAARAMLSRALSEARPAPRRSLTRDTRWGRLACPHPPFQSLLHKV